MKTPAKKFQMKTLISALLLTTLLSNLGFACTAGSDDSKGPLENFQPSLLPETKDRLGRLFEREAQYQHLSGAVWISSGDSVLHREAYAMRDADVPNDLSSRFDIGSISKQFTAAAILHLVKEGKFNLHDPINPLLGDYASKRWDRVNVHHLLTHTAGIPSIYQTEQGLDIFFPESFPISLKDLIGKFDSEKTLFRPGEEFAYSNSGYVLLAAIVEQTSGQAFFDYLEEHIFTRYELTSTSFSRNDLSAIPKYGFREDLTKPAPIYHPSWMIGGGGVYATVEDLSKWIDVITDPSFLNDTLREAFLSSQTPSGYGYGWVVGTDGFLSHDGASAGFTGQLRFHPATKTKIILLTNRGFEDIKQYDKAAAFIQNLCDQAATILEGKEGVTLPEIRRTTQLNGIFQLEEKRLSIVAKSDSSISVELTGLQPSRVIKNVPLVGKDSLETKMIEITTHLANKAYWKFAKHGDSEMKLASYSGLVGIGMRIMKQQTGKVLDFIPYYVDSKDGLFLMKGEKGNLEMIAYFDGEGKVEGIFENGFTAPDRGLPMVAYALGNDRFYLDGLPYGENSLFLEMREGRLIFQDLGREVTAYQ